MGGDKSQPAEAAAQTVQAYRDYIGRYGEMGRLQMWYDRIDERAILDALSPSARRRAQRVMDKARIRGSQRSSTSSPRRSAAGIGSSKNFL
jgi:hypothetical protein